MLTLQPFLHDQKAQELREEQQERRQRDREMASLDIPSIKRAGSSSSINHAAIEHENDLAAVAPKSRRNSASSAVPTSSTAGSLTSHPAVCHEVPHPTCDRHRTTLMTAQTLAQPPTPHNRPMTTLYGGKAHKAVTVETSLLTDKSPFFKRLLAETPEPLPEQTTFEDADETALAMFGAWMHGKQLHGPNDFHSTGHYLALYVLAGKFGCETLENEVMDLFRSYYHSADMTAPPYRLQYIYACTTSDNPMRAFLVASAA
ncbi:hypothetical protein LTR53_000570 [Teratosphaeriaceae sp. CCFEE 6253]|nr:hypothetical protein LTR53_000570 [Teratosphaeriaceae sp. CCFEE 6253]